MWHDSPLWYWLCKFYLLKSKYIKNEIIKQNIIDPFDDNKYICEIFEGVLEKWKIKLSNIYLFYYPKTNCVYLL